MKVYVAVEAGFFNELSAVRPLEFIDEITTLSSQNF